MMNPYIQIRRRGDAVVAVRVKAFSAQAAVNVVLVHLRKNPDAAELFSPIEGTFFSPDGGGWWIAMAK